MGEEKDTHRQVEEDAKENLGLKEDLELSDESAEAVGGARGGIDALIAVTQIKVDPAAGQ
jgi:hypothetical protein